MTLNSVYTWVSDVRHTRGRERRQNAGLDSFLGIECIRVTFVIPQREEIRYTPFVETVYITSIEASGLGQWVLRGTPISSVALNCRAAGRQSRASWTKASHPST